MRNGPEEAWKQYSNTEVVEVSAAPPAYLHTYFSCNYRRVGTKIGLQRVKFHICVNYESKCLKKLKVSNVLTSSSFSAVN